MTPIQSVCPACLAKVAAGIEQLHAEGKDDGQNSLHTWCQHNGVAITIEVKPGGIGGHWIIQPASSENEARERIEQALAEAEELRLVRHIVMQYAKPAGNA